MLFNSILFYHASFYLIIDFCFLIPAAIAQIFNPIAELVISMGVPSKETKAKIEMHLVITEAKMRKCSVQF